MADLFNVDTKDVLAKRVGVRCSNPDCRQLTSGPQVDRTKVLNIGVAAHITAASPGGPRFDEGLSSEERRAIDNGIWLCQTCAKLVDNDPARFSSDLLQKWKRLAEDSARIECESRCNVDRQMRDRFPQSSKILSYGGEHQFSIDCSSQDAERRFWSFAKLMRQVVGCAFYNSCLSTPYEDFVFLASFIAPKVAPQDEKMTFRFEISCHVTHFVSTFQELMDAMLKRTSDEYLSLLSNYPDDLAMQSEFAWDQLTPHRITRTGPKSMILNPAKPIRSLEPPFSTSSLLSLLGQIYTTHMLIIDDYSGTEGTENIMKYLARINDTGRFSLDDIVLDKSNAERFAIELRG